MRALRKEESAAWLAHLQKRAAPGFRVPQGRGDTKQT